MPADIPRLGLGTWSNTDPDQCATSVRTALELGYRHIDTAQAYHNEEAVGRGIRESSIDREEIVVATKVSPGNLAYDDVIASTAESCERLGLATIDLLYVHWPHTAYDPADTMSAFDDLRDDGIIRHVGASNFEPDQLAEARAHLEAPIVANQIEMHPLCPQDALQNAAQEDDHWVVAYSPLARGELFGYSVVREIAADYEITPAQVCLAWLFSKPHVAAVPKATGEGHIRENFEARNMTLDADAIDRLDAIDDRKRLVNPTNAPWNQPTS